MFDPGTRILDKYVLRQCIGSGAFGEVWHADSVSTGQLVAIKMERIQGNPPPTLQYESRVLQLLQGEPGIPKLRYFGRKDDMNAIFMVTDLLGPSLETVATSPRFDLDESMLKNPPPQHAEFISAIGRQMLQRLRSVHSRGMLHRDVKPDNFLFARTSEMDLSRRASTNKTMLPLLCIIDFGMAKRINLDDTSANSTASSSSSSSSTSTQKSLIGSPRYASIFAHQGQPLGRRDDLISMMYSLIYVARGGVLPWQNYTEREIYYIKDNMTPSEVCAGLFQPHADGWSAILERLYDMKVNEVPNYVYIDSLL